MADQQSTERRTSAVATAGGAHPGVLLPYAYPGTRLGDPALDDRRALDPGPSSSPKTVKDVSRQTVKHVLGLDTLFTNVGFGFGQLDLVKMSALLQHVRSLRMLLRDIRKK